MKDPPLRFQDLRYRTESGERKLEGHSVVISRFQDQVQSHLTSRSNFEKAVAKILPYICYDIENYGNIEHYLPVVISRFQQVSH